MWSRLADLPLVVEDYELDRLEAEAAFGHDRGTDRIRLIGGGTDGLGEDVTPLMPDPIPAPRLPLAGEWTFGTFAEHLATVDQWTTPPEWDMARRWRNWAYESAGLDLALRQAGRALHEVLEVEPQPVRFVNSFGLGDPPDIDTFRRRLERYPGLRFKLDAAATWSQEILAELAATGAVDTIDFKGQYHLEVKDADALLVLYGRVVDIFPDAILEDPHDLPGVAEILEPHVDRVSYDAPIGRVEDFDKTPLRARIVNVKPMRIGGFQPLFQVYAHCRAQGVRMYGGGMGELGVARGQIELLASLFHADGPNDVAPTRYNDEHLPEGLPTSPLTPAPEPTGFRWAV